MNRTIRFFFAAVLCCMVGGCATKLVKIDSMPAFAEIRINNETIGKTPMYHRFYNRWYPWPMEKTDDFMIQAQLPGFEPEVKIFHETPDTEDFNYVPDEVIFRMNAIAPQETVE